MMTTLPYIDNNRSGPLLRVLVVEDYEPFRRLIASILQQRPGLQVLCEVSDGLEAVRIAQEMRPDLILLDIGLPSLNGIEVARQIRKLVPESKILFLSQESSPDVVQEALDQGALGYVVKASAGSELIAAVDAVCQGKPFVSRGLSDRSVAFPQLAPAPPLRHETSLSSRTPETEGAARRHGVQLYSDDASLLAGFACFIEASLNARTSVIVIATEPHRKSLLQSLQANGVDIAAAVEQGNYTPLDVAESLSAFMVNDRPDSILFFKAAGDLIRAAAGKGTNPRIAACGECSPALLAQGHAEAAIQLEHLWDEIARRYKVDVLCGYVVNTFQLEQENRIYERICAEHSVVYSG